jgi:hypothetical protein
MDVMDTASAKAKKSTVWRRVKQETRSLMGRRGVLATMLGSLLFCVLVTFASYSFYLLLISLFSLLPLTVYGAAILTDLSSALALLAFVLLALPLWLGRLRMSGLIWMGQSPVAAELFYYFNSWRRLARAWRISFVALMGAFLPVGLLFLLYQCAYFVAPGLPLLLYTLAVLFFGVALLFLSSFWMLFTGIAVGNEAMPVRVALECALRAGKRGFFRLGGFTLYSLAWLLLGILTVGILPLFYSAHFYNLSYLRLCMAFCPKEDVIQ